ncbi:hypothetical protein DM43_5423 [Burkholderia cepacia]|uniref:Uncharacterized protein n=1 Tax=Burkholderia cepacia TaxID=292 RepID=A0AA88Z5L6_BURCE|nr:hypothetical protein DM43_5423 [Burkholderia cepacia]
MKKRRRCPFGHAGVFIGIGRRPPRRDQLRRNRLAPYTSADSAVIQKLVGQSV